MDHTFPLHFLHNQKLGSGKAWERGYVDLPLPNSALNTELHSCMLQLCWFFMNSQELLKVISVDPHFFCTEVYHTFVFTHYAKILVTD